MDSPTQSTSRHSLHFFCRGRCSTLRLSLLLGLLLIGSCPRVWGQTKEAPATSVPQLTRKIIDERLANVQNAKGIDENLKIKIVDLYSQSSKSLEAAAAWEEQARKFRDAATSVEDRKQGFEQQLREIEKPASPNASETSDAINPDAEKLKQILAAGEQELQELQKHLEDPQTGLRQLLSKLKAEGARRTKRTGEIAALMTQQRMDKISEQLNLPVNPDEPPELGLANRTLSQARLQEYTRQLAAERFELDQYAAEDQAGLLRLHRDVLSLQITATEKQLKKAQDRVNTLRSRQASQQVKQAEEDVAQAVPELSALADENKKLAEQNEELTAQIQATEKRRGSLLKKRKELKSQYDEIKEMIQTVGQTDVIGELLRSQRITIPHISQFQKQLGPGQKTVSDLPVDWYKFEKSRDELIDVDAAILQTLSRLTPAPPRERQKTLEEPVRKLLESRKTLLDDLIESSKKLFAALVTIDNDRVLLVQLTDEFTTYIDERVLWIRSNDVLSPSTAGPTAEAFGWLFNPSRWLSAARSFVAPRWQEAIELVLTFCLFVALIYYRHRLRNGIALLGDKASPRNCHSFLPTAHAVLLTLLLAALWPGMVWYFSWRLSSHHGGDEFISAVAQGLGMVAAVYFPLEIIRQCCASKGLAEMHFGWSITAVRLIRTQLRWATPLGLPLIFIAGTIHVQPNEAWQDSLGRLSVIAGLILLTVLMHRTLRPQTGIIRELLGYKSDGWIDQVRYVVYGFAVLVPAGLAVLTVMGYYYTVIQLGGRLHETVWLFIVLLLIQAVLLRLILVHRRGLAMEQHQARLARAQEARLRESAAGDEQTEGAPVPTDEERDTNLRASMSQTQKLLKTFLAGAAIAGMWIIWADVLPALGVLDRMPLWETTVTVTEEIPTSEEGTETRTNEIRKPITIANLAMCVLVAILAIVAAQNIPGLIEMSMLRGLPFETGFRYAISSLARYVIVIVGLAISLNVIGIGWDKMQWLFAAASLGLGFGLQEIFANFISGIIILFERPIRVGDIITIDAVSGVVSKIRIRATTITNWDRQELIVPNKDFITGRLLNWTLSDQINRVVVNVGVAYGSDTSQVRELLLNAARENEFILDDPGPSATFQEFGDSTLGFVLRAYLPNLDNRMGVVHALHCEINRRFAEADIEMAFPQQDIHVRSLPEGFGDKSK